MRHDVIQAARNIPRQLQEAVSAMFAESEQPLREAVGSLKSSLAKVSSYVESIEVPRGKPGRKPAAVTSGEAPKVTRRRRKRGRFPTSDFLIQQMKDNPSGLRPRQLADKLEEAAGKGKHSNVLSVTNTSLGRLKSLGLAASHDGIWKLTGKGTTASATPSSKGTKKTKRRRGRRKKTASAA